MGSFENFTISKFLGLNTTKDVLTLLPGQLRKNNNYTYMATGGLQERGGGAKLINAPSAGNPLFSLSNYVSQDGTEFLVTNQGTDAFFFSSAAWNALSLTLTSNKRMTWALAGAGAARALYGVNGSDSVTKIIGNSPVGSAVSNSPTTATFIKFHKNRLFAVDDDTLFFTEVLDFDTWNTTTNTIDIAPGVDGLIKSLEVWGDALFIFKEFGVYVLPNADDVTPKLNWVILRADALTGTQSPATVRRTRIGIMYFSSDKFVRVLSPTVSFSTGEYTLGGSGSPIVSEDLRGDIDEILDSTQKSTFTAIVHEDLYILAVQTVNNSGDFNDKTYFADVTKLLQQPDKPTLQPFWGEFTGFDYDFFSEQIQNEQVKLFAVKGASGETHETLNLSINNDNGGAIESHAIVGWHPLNNDAIYKKITRCNFTGDTEDWNLNLIFNAYKYGRDVPTEGSGQQRTYTTSSTAGGSVGSAIVGTSTVGLIGVGSKVIRLGLRGHFFSCEFKNLNADEFTRVDKLAVYYRNVRSS